MSTPVTSISVLGQEFKSVVELQAFVQAQHKMIAQLTQRNKELENEVKKHNSESSLVSLDKSSTNATVCNINDEEIIVRCQIKQLKDIALTQPLTLEEAKKLDIYCKILNTLENKPKNNQIDVSKIPTKDLLKQLKELEENERR